LKQIRLEEYDKIYNSLFLKFVKDHEKTITTKVDELEAVKEKWKAE